MWDLRLKYLEIKSRIMKELMLVIGIVFLFACSKSEINDPDHLPRSGKNGGGILSSKTVLISDEFEGSKIVVAGNERDNYIVSFQRTIDGVLLDFRTSTKSLPVIMEDNEGNSWDIFGYASDGPRAGERLTPTQSLMGYWFSFATFYPGVQIYPKLDKGANEGAKISGTGNWLIPEDEVRSGGVGRDGIPAISDPNFNVVSEQDYLENDDLVVGFSYEGNVVAYPHNVLDWHEIINDAISDLNFAIVYCPLTGTATAWDRKINGQVTTFGVSGLLYNTNIVPYDRATKSNWSQLFNGAVWGTNKGRKAKNHMVVETSMSTWKQLYPASKVMNFSTDYARDYGRYPYGDYKNSKQLIFPVKYEDNRLHKKERVHAIIVNGKARVYRFSSFLSN